MTVYPRLRHGYLNLDFPFGMPIVKNCVNHTILSLKILLKLEKCQSTKRDNSGNNM